MATRGFTGRQRSTDTAARIPPGQHLVDGFPVLSAGPVPTVSLDKWNFELKDGVRVVRTWTWSQFNQLPITKITRDIHCVTSWSKLDTLWEGVTIDDLFAAAGIEPTTSFLLAHSIDYAGLFPPADLVLEPALLNQADYVRSADRWMLGTFVLPVGKFSEARAQLAQFDKEHSLQISALGPKTSKAADFRIELEKAAKAIKELQAEHEGVVAITQFEMPLPTGSGTRWMRASAAEWWS